LFAILVEISIFRFNYFDYLVQNLFVVQKCHLLSFKGRMNEDLKTGTKMDAEPVFWFQFVKPVQGHRKNIMLGGSEQVDKASIERVKL